jgi:hypothetical protein
VDGVDDPYIRAVLRKIGGDSWEAVLSEDMALLDKITIAVCNLNDKEVSAIRLIHGVPLSLPKILLDGDVVNIIEATQSAPS